MWEHTARILQGDCRGQACSCATSFMCSELHVQPASSTSATHPLICMCHASSTPVFTCPRLLTRLPTTPTSPKAARSGRCSMLVQATRRLDSIRDCKLHSMRDCKLRQTSQTVQRRQPPTSTQGGGDKRRDTRCARRKHEETNTERARPDQERGGDGATTCMRASLTCHQDECETGQLV